MTRLVEASHPGPQFRRSRTGSGARRLIIVSSDEEPLVPECGRNVVARV